ncbi:MAG: HAD hydrolase-like protein [Actinomycetia bacterium]|nr:HAD hydrolase-like protein [Actinomycetes bacterium]MCP4962969.1 HAD hydrolase-like protein [Actinomycetes bacterium]
MAWVLDLDGVIWIGSEPIAGAADAVGRLRAGGERVLFVTNFSALTVAGAEAKLAAVGIEATGDVITSSMAAGSLISPGETVLVAGGPGVAEAVVSAGGTVAGPEVPPDQIGTVMVGFHREFDFARVTRAARAIHAGARLVATNLDPTYPTPEGLEPGNGALVASIATAGKIEPVVAGKPHQPVADLVHRTLGTAPGDPANHDRHIVVGDLAATDGALACRLGYEFALVLSGVTNAEQVQGLDPAPDVVTADLASLVTQRIG